MQQPLSLVFLASLLLASCGSPSAATLQQADTRWEQELQNPLFAERYWDELTERMVNVQLYGEDAAKDPRKMAVLDEVRRMAVQKSQEVRVAKRDGIMGSFVTVLETTEGLVLLRGHTLSFSPHFFTYPGAALKIYLTTMVDPREGTFPDAGSIEVGRLESPYGAQEYQLAEVLKTEGTRSVVLYDAKLDRLYGFAQLQ